MSDESPLPVTDRTRHRRLREQGSTDRADLADILAAGVICHLGVVVDGYAMVVPVWAGVLPLAAAWQDPEPDPVLPPEIPLPPHIAARLGRPLG
jgi:hypothetical protein